jgi:hypothetical protein
MTDEASQPATGEPDPGEIVPEFWPPADPIEPVNAWRIHWLLAPLATIPAALLPRRMGPHLANSSWAAAYVAHIFSGFVAVGIAFAVAIRYAGGGEPSLAGVLLCNPLVELRRALAGSILLLYGMWNGWAEILGTLLAVAMIEAGIWVGALLLIPLYAVGEGARRTYLRCVKLLLWSSACQIPISWLFMHFGFWAEVHVSGPVGFLSTWGACELWWLWVLVRLGGRYGGPQEGPRWQNRQPRCETCGYSLVSLPVHGRCPECGTGVAKSLPQRRRPTEFATAHGPLGRCVGFWKTTWQVVFCARRFARNVTIWGHHRSARAHATRMCILIGAICAVTGFVAHWIAVGGFSPARWLDGRPLTWNWGDLFSMLSTAMLSGILGGLIAAVLTLTTGLVLSHFGFRDVADRVVVLCYGTAWLLVPALLATAGSWAAWAVIETWGPFQSFRVAEDTWIDWEAVLWLACQLPAAATLLVSFLRIRVMLRYTRYANA